MLSQAANIDFVYTFLKVLHTNKTRGIPRWIEIDNRDTPLYQRKTALNDVEQPRLNSKLFHLKRD